ncbi:cingulin-like isoform X2 [Limulus polyphemus]|nr:cingulin-like isoform X2 [Limulus polyphemus]XP_022243891.1 cingulin-like isoform X2 [Limulus polyphemus]
MAENQEVVAEGVADDEEFGEFEGFEGAPLEPVQAQPAPSPWATFPDLLPVQNSSAASVDEDPSSPVRPTEPLDEPWLVAAAAASSPQRYPALSSSAATTVSFQQSRTSNPPDISLANCQVIGNELIGACDITQSSRLSNPPDISLAEFSQTDGDLNNERESSGPSSWLSNPPDVSIGARPVLSVSDSPDEIPGGSIPVLINNASQASVSESNTLQRFLQDVPPDLGSLQAQVQELQQERTHQQEQIEALQHTNMQLEQQLSERQREARDLRTQLEETQESLHVMERRLASEHSSVGTLLHKIEQTQDWMDKEKEVFYGQLREEIKTLEQRLQGQRCDDMDSLHKFVEKCIQRCSEELCDNVTSLLKDAVVSHSSNHQNLHVAELVEQFKKELQVQSAEQRKLLQQERRQQFLMLSSTLQSVALQLKTGYDETDQNEETES